MPIAPTLPSPHDQHIPQTENLLKLLLLPALLAGSFVLADRIASLTDSQALQLLLVQPLAIANGMLIIAFGALAHEAVHRVLFRNAIANEWLGGIASAMMLTPFQANRQFHLTHHAHAHQPQLDPENGMHHRSFWLAMTAGSLVGLWLQYRIFSSNVLRGFTNARYRERTARDAVCLAIAALFYIGLPMSLQLDLLLTSGMTVLVFPLVFAFRALSDHYGLPPVLRKSQRLQVIEDGNEWQQDIEPASVTGWVILTQPWLAWLWSNVNYHEVHHKYPWLAHCHLPAAFSQTRDTVPYRITDGYWRSFLSLMQKNYYDG